MASRFVRRMASSCATGFACVVLPAAAQSAETAAPGDRTEPLWEAGAGIGGVHFPDYRGSDRSRNYLFPVPYFVYRGEFLRADRNGLRGMLMHNDRIDLNASVGASLPVDSSRDPVREGMPDLRATIELGPSLDVTLWRNDDRRKRLDVRLPVRAGVTLESQPRFIGWQFFPHLNLDVRDPAGLAGWNLGLLAGPIFSDARHNRYFYEVAPEFATPERPAFTPPGGFAGMEYLAAVSKRYPKFWVGGFVRYDSLHGATFEESPLVTSKRYAAAGFGISWILGESAQRVTVNPFDERSAR